MILKDSEFFMENTNTYATDSHAAASKKMKEPPHRTLTFWTVILIIVNVIPTYTVTI